MKLEELEEAMRTERDHHLVLFLPFVRLKTSCTVAGIEFVPLRDADGKVPSILETALGPLKKILSGYIDRHGKPLDNCVVATIPGRGWNLERDDFRLSPGRRRCCSSRLGHATTTTLGSAATM